MAQELQKWLETALREYVYHRENKVCVVSIVGKAPCNEVWTKGTIINEITNKNAFQNISFSNGCVQEKACKIETYFDPDSQCVFLNLISPYEINVHEFGDETQNFHQWWIEQDLEYTSHLLFLFSVSQIILFVHPTCRFDINYVRLFRVLNHLREKTVNNVCELLSDINGVSKTWVSDGRPACPRVLFLFHRPPSFMKPDGTVETRRGSYRKLAVCLEDQIYKLFRKSRVITNNAASSVCSLPNKQSFCYIFGPSEEPKDFTQELLNSLLLSKSSPTEETKRNADHNNEDGGFKELFFDHCDLAHGEGFNDNLGKIGPAHFELPKFKAFVRASSVLFNFFVKKRSESADLNEIPQLIDVISKFSEGRCNKVLPIAIGNYQDNLPSFYTEVQHRSKLLQALKVLQQQARGPALESARQKLTEDCESYWRNGRQACESFSLTGNSCINRVHRTRARKGDTNLPIMPHNSKVKYLGTCNCGRRQAWRDDPFDIKEANYSFYEENEEFTCCTTRLDRIDFPVYQRTTTVAPSTPPVSGGSTSGRKVSVEQLFDNLKITPTTQEELSGQARTTGDDFLPDRDNKPAPKRISDSQAECDQEAADFKVADDGDGNAADEVELPASAVERIKTQEEEPIDDEIGTGGTGSDLSEVLKDSHYSQDERDEQNAPSESDIENEGAGDLDVTQVAEERPSSRIRNEDDDLGWGASPEEEDEATVEKEHEAEESDEDAEKGLYLVGMVHNQCTPGLLPLFSSWSLVCLGHSSIYSHSGGLRDYPNFSHGSQYLLAWDVPLHVDIERWQDLMESMASTSKRMGVPYKKMRPLKNERDDTVTVKIFIGFEYECPRGHRFMLQSPEKMLKYPGPGGPKDNGALIAKNDMPLWFPCSCRQAKPAYLGQLMRVHIVTPKAPVIVTLNPKVQPHTNLPLVFHPGAPGPAKLGPAKYWILRLPFAYVGPSGTLYSPKESGLPAGRVLKNMVGVIPDM